MYALIAKMKKEGKAIILISEEMAELIQAYKDLGEEGLWENLAYFINEIMPTAIEFDVNMGIHPDDPPWSIFGIPRIITCEENIDRFLSL